MEISVTLIIIVITTLVSLGAFSNGQIMGDLIFHPPSARRQVYRFFSHGLIHADWGHLIFNMLALYFFGMGSRKTGLEYDMIDIFGPNGRWYYLLMYLAALAVSVLPTYFRHANDYHYRSLGASGAVSAVIFAFILLHPLALMGLMFVPVYVAGFIFAILYLAISSWLDRRGGDNINHSAHIWGAIFGIAFLLILCWINDLPIIRVFIMQLKSADPAHFIQVGSGSF